MDEKALSIIGSSEVQQYLRDHENDDERLLILKQKTILGLPSAQIATQIAGRRKAKYKLPFLYNQEVIYPPAVNLEQSSSQLTAEFKAELLRTSVKSHRLITDLTGGFGIDSYFFSKVFQHVDHVEPGQDLSSIARYNHQVLGANNIRHRHSSAESWLQHTESADAMFIDPSRRNRTAKVFTLADSSPNVVEIQDKIFSASDILLVKASPLLDIKIGLAELKFVKRVEVVAVSNEVKELLFLCEKGFSSTTIIEACNIHAGKAERFSFELSQEADASVELAGPQQYIYEPNAAILKAGAFKLVATRNDLGKLHVNTHLYTSQKLIADFPGRIFEAQKEVKSDAKAVRTLLQDGQANVVVRNYPLTAMELRKKLRLTEGGEKFLIAFTGPKEKHLIIASRLK